MIAMTKLITRKEFLAGGLKGLGAVLLLGMGLKSMEGKKGEPIAMSIKVKATPKVIK